MLVWNRGPNVLIIQQSWTCHWGCLVLGPALNCKHAQVMLNHFAPTGLNEWHGGACQQEMLTDFLRVCPRLQPMKCTAWHLGTLKMVYEGHAAMWIPVEMFRVLS
jgi:hypothetical protein|uniref:Uncharacterized protein n=1 Tax=Eutreptiella gymnastica TaxID=73025 RepID=A0A7S4CZ30_9EUGL|mmetsp:Transcript_62085/g.103084  ORF Transcript_62085/g.103084 Transcript_62085/m.103084 type:complete len:105 (-) Transcript_62085:44-358(-)